MAVAGSVLGCESGHGFDVARQGHVNLLGRAAPANADTPAMLAARERFLASGHYSPVSEPVADAVAGRERLLEVGAGTGHYLARALDASPRSLGLATDVSPAAARRAARAHPRMAAAVADTWAGLPLADASVDAVLCVFAPRNAAEFARVLRPGGLLVVVVPGPEHLVELRRAHDLLDVGADKLEGVTNQLRDLLRPVARTEVRRLLRLDEEEATALVGMGPNAFHSTPARVPAGEVTLQVTIATFTAH
ncbi:methyltransferase domain-containing protein [Tessaracoccus rhinocerotis]|uniref:Methyltransferase domain-containing protein n=2 Tax=Tessaracoccus rhinocerotis TaxID=1689449 RepID=A0A553K324_9ACTN|nr:methyltransferase domain-containing protein [Tessaracoccus rhinocerotis]TRY19113.1 methyltransferase domain-containing protein [Tessaracoccus rhinocerotis]